jgi:hypothetical protein
MVAEDIKRVPGLYMAWVEPGQSEPVTFNDRIIPEAFTTFLHFNDKAKTWLIEFRVVITKGGTPLLKSVTTYGSKLKDGETDTVQRWQLKVVEQYRYTLLELAVELAITTRWPTVMLRREYNAENMAVSRAITTGLGHKPNQIMLEHPSTIKGNLPSGEVADFVRFWDGNPNPVVGKELTQLQRDIGTAIRRRITDKFLKEVAGVYEQAVAVGLDPNTEICNVYKVEPRTARGWTKMARAPHLKYLPKTTQGKVTVKRTTKRKGKA